MSLLRKTQKQLFKTLHLNPFSLINHQRKNCLKLLFFMAILVISPAAQSQVVNEKAVIKCLATELHEELFKNNEEYRAKSLKFESLYQQSVQEIQNSRTTNFADLVTIPVVKINCYKVKYGSVIGSILYKIFLS